MMRPTPDEMNAINQISEEISELKTRMMRLLSETVMADRERILKIVAQGRDMDERGNASLCAHLEWAIRGGDG